MGKEAGRKRVELRFFDCLFVCLTFLFGKLTHGKRRRWVMVGLVVGLVKGLKAKELAKNSQILRKFYLILNDMQNQGLWPC